MIVLPDANIVFLTSLSFSHLGAGVPKNWPYKKFIEHKLLQMKRSGTTAFIAERWDALKPVCEEELEKDSLALGPGMAQACIICISLVSNQECNA